MSTPKSPNMDTSCCKKPTKMLNWRASQSGGLLDNMVFLSPLFVGVWQMIYLQMWNVGVQPFSREHRKRCWQSTVFQWLTLDMDSADGKSLIWRVTQLAFYVNLHRAVIGPSATLTGRWRPDIDLRRMLTGNMCAAIGKNNMSLLNTGFTDSWIDSLIWRWPSSKREKKLGTMLWILKCWMITLRN